MQGDTPISVRSYVLHDPRGFFAFGCGAGLVPIAPGTAGSAVALFAAPLLAELSLASYLLFLIVTFFLGVMLCQHAAETLGVHDHPGIVWDEFVGIWTTLLVVPAHWSWWLAAFALFRLFDIWKPWPIKWIDRHVSGGFGIMLDDLLAALYAMVLLKGAEFCLG